MTLQGRGVAVGFLGICALIAASAANAAPDSIGKFRSHSTSGRSVVIEAETGQKLRITPYGARIVRVQAAAAGQAFVADDRYEFVERHDWPGNFAVQDFGAYLTLDAGEGLKVRVTKNPLRVSFYRGGELVLAEDAVDGIQTGARPAVRFASPAGDERFAGLGHGKFGRVDKLDLRGQVIERGSDTQSPLIVPFYLSTKGYGISLNSSWKNRFSFKNADYGVSLSGGQMDYFYVDGPSFAGIIDRYTSLIGKPRLLPIYALGLMMSDKDRDSRGTPSASLPGSEWWKQTHAMMKDGGWPLEVLVHDNTWRDGKIAPWDWHPRHYPDPAEFERWSRANGIVSMLDFNRGDAPLSEGWRREYALPGTSSYPDFSSPTVRAWFWGLMRDKAFDPALGFPADMIWMDEFDMNPNVSAPLASGRSWEEEQNNYYFLRDKTLGEGWDATLQGGKRPFFMNRGMMAGSQRMGASLWSGDINASYGEMKSQIRGMLQAGLSGVPYWGMDQGGFKSIPTDDLYRNWALAQGAFSVIWKPHGLGRRYPWLFSAEAQAEMREYGALRSSLVPYLYTYAAEAANTGAPVTRAMIFEHAHDARAWDADEQYLLGREMIVAPVTGPGNPKVKVWLPKGKWYDYWTDAPVEGDRVIQHPATVGTIPVFVRAGAIVPRAKPAMSTAFLDRSHSWLHVYAGANGAFDLYEDDGVTDAYRTGAWRASRFAWDEGSRQLVIGEARGSYPGAASARTYEIVVHGLSASPARVLLDGAELPASSREWNAGMRALVIRTGSLDVGASHVLELAR